MRILNIDASRNRKQRQDKNRQQQLALHDVFLQKKNNVFISKTWNATAAPNAKKATIMQMENSFIDYSSLPTLFVPE